MSSTGSAAARRSWALVGGLAVVAALTGCATAERFRERDVPAGVLSDFLQDKPEPLRPHYAVLLRQGQRNLVLNHMRVGLAAMELGAYPVAKESFDQALLGIEAVYADSETAKQARKFWTAEAYKDFKGEPYERAMAYYYRGLLYLRDGDYENARASFKGGMLQDAFAEEEQNRSDFALLAFLEGWASRCAGSKDLATQGFEEVGRIEVGRQKSGFSAPGAGDNLLMIAETGTSPVKFGDGPKRSLLKLRRGAGFEESQVRFQLGGTSTAGYHVEDIFWQASTRGGRPIDNILEGKVTFKEGTNTAGNVMLGLGTATLLAGASYRSNEAMIAGGALLLLGLAAKGVSEATRPEADARYWDNLPDGVHLASVALPADGASVRVDFLDASGNAIEPRSRTVDVTRAGPCGLAWARARSAVPSEPRAPGTVTTVGQ
jgi:tetratricopeptide (TPR) repeat protein